MSEEIRVWGIHTLDDNLFLKENVIAIGWHEMGDLSLIDANRDAFKEQIEEIRVCCTGLLLKFKSAIT